jgi:hypothetical protein
VWSSNASKTLQQSWKCNEIRQKKIIEEQRKKDEEEKKKVLDEREKKIMIHREKLYNDYNIEEKILCNQVSTHSDSTIIPTTKKDIVNYLNEIIYREYFPTVIVTLIYDYVDELEETEFDHTTMLSIGFMIHGIPYGIWCYYAKCGRYNNCGHCYHTVLDEFENCINLLAIICPSIPINKDSRDNFILYRYVRIRENMTDTIQGITYGTVTKYYALCYDKRDFFPTNEYEVICKKEITRNIILNPKIQREMYLSNHPLQMV